MTQPLVLNAPPQRGGWSPDARPFVILEGQFRPQAFADLPALARFVHRRRDGRALRLSDCVAHYAGSETFRAVAVWFGEGADERYAFTLAAGVGRAAIEAAIAANNPDQPDLP